MGQGGLPLLGHAGAIVQKKAGFGSFSAMPSADAALPQNSLVAAAGWCRDVCAEVRAVVIRAIGSWVAEHPSSYLNDAHLKYLVGT